MKREEQDALRAREVDALEEIAWRVRELNLRPREEAPGERSWMARFPALRVALSLCRDVEAGEGLVQRFKRVPDEYVDRAERRVRCVCGSVTGFGDVHPCPGACGRFFCADASGAWAVKFEPEELAA